MSLPGPPISTSAAQARVDWTNRAQFVGPAAVMMRGILVSHARDRVAEKRGGVQERVSLRVVEAFAQPEVDVLALHVEREWSFARAWLYDALCGDPQSPITSSRPRRGCAGS